MKRPKNLTRNKKTQNSIKNNLQMTSYKNSLKTWVMEGHLRYIKCWITSLLVLRIMGGTLSCSQSHGTSLLQVICPYWWQTIAHIHKLNGIFDGNHHSTHPQVDSSGTSCAQQVEMEFLCSPVEWRLGNWSKAHKLVTTRL